ncbi:DNA polymerase III subunit delta' [Desulfovibrio sp. OttesenSCG-928-F07]|nr:DNA polymerase III subunit delta' [Desulfovibrio sp. OttesenSCG-928-F07]
MAKKATVKDKPEDILPDAAEQERLLDAARTFAAAPRFAAARKAFATLSANPPQCLLFEGGSMQDRANAALYWAALLNCPAAANTGPHLSPCLSCPTCLHFVSRIHRDLFFFDGSEASIKIDDIRAMRPVLGEPPRDAKNRAVILFEAQALGEAAANALLKSLEEPKPGTIFVLTTPQRERLLPTLVSRSWVLTLPWPSTDEFSQISGQDLSLVSEWGRALLQFAESGRGWMGRDRKGVMDSKLAMNIVLLCQNALTQALAGRSEGVTPLTLAFARLSPLNQRILSEALAEAQESLNYNINATLVTDWLATRIYFLFKREPAA